MTNLEALLRARMSDARAMTGVLNINADRVFLDFGQIGEISRIRLRIKGSDIEVVSPEDARIAWQEAEAEKAGANRNGGAIVAIERDGHLFAAPGLREITLPPGYVLVSEAELDAVLSQIPQEPGADGQDGPPDGGSGAEGVEPATGPENGVQRISPDDHSKSDLVDIATAENVVVSAAATKAQIADAINAARGL